MNLELSEIWELARYYADNRIEKSKNLEAWMCLYRGFVAGCNHYEEFVLKEYEQTKRYRREDSGIHGRDDD